MRRADGVPVAFLAGAQHPVELHRVNPKDPQLAESQMQRLVVDHPEVLPIQELDDTFTPALPIGVEVGTSVGPIDALYISPSGGITIVEAKLWRNPEARREVVGQIIDYATALSSWSYEELDSACVSASGRSLWDLVSDRAGDGLPGGEAGFVDAVARNLQQGRFLLLVVGDGIRGDVERMASYIQTAPRLQFHLALVELRIFTSDDDRVRVVVPSVVARTAEIARAVVKVDVADRAQVDVEVSVPIDDSRPARRKLTMDEFFRELRARTSPDIADFTRTVLADFEADDRYVIEPRAASQVVKIANIAGGSDFTVLVFKTDGHVHPGWLSGQCHRVGIPKDVAFAFVADLSRLLDVPVHPKYADTLAVHPPAVRLQRSWQLVADRIEAVTQEILAHLD
jgi:hypothetical protein